jgi:transposase
MPIDHQSERRPVLGIRHRLPALARNLADRATDGADNRVSPAVRGILNVLARQYGAIGTEIASIDKSIMALHRACEAGRRLADIPGVGPVGATALIAEIGDWNAFSSGRSLAVWIG